MSEIIVEEEIMTDENPSVIQTDEIVRGEKGEKGDQGLKGRDGRDGLNGQDGKDGRNGSDGRDGRDGRDGVDGLHGKDGKNGSKGDKGSDGQAGEAGKDGTVWYLFKTVVDENKGVEGDLGLVESTSNYYRKEFKAGNLIWKWKGNLKGKDGEEGKQGRDGSSTYYNTGNGGGSVVSNVLPFAPLTKFSSGKLTNLDTDDFNMISCCELPIGSERAKMDMGVLSELCN